VRSYPAIHASVRAAAAETPRSASDPRPSAGIGSPRGDLRLPQAPAPARERDPGVQLRSEHGSPGGPTGRRPAVHAPSAASDPGAAGGIDVSSLEGLAGLAETLKQAAQQGNVDVTQSSQTLDLRGTGLREEIVEIMKRHGIDPDSASVQGAQINAASMPGMQAEMLEALKRHGIDAGDASIQIDGSQHPQPGQ
jgi:protein-tyrosine-phosphatase